MAQPFVFAPQLASKLRPRRPHLGHEPLDSRHRCLCQPAQGPKSSVRVHRHVHHSTLQSLPRRRQLHVLSAQKTSKSKEVSKLQLERNSGDVQEKWRFLDWQAYNQAWQVPWGSYQLVLGMGAWALSFLGVGVLVVPLLVRGTGVTDFLGLTAQDKAIYALLNQVLEVIVTFGVLRFTLREFQPLNSDLFNFSFGQPFRKPDGWLAWGLLGVVLSPVVIGVTAVALSATGYESVGGRGTADGVAQLLSLDVSTYASLLTITAVLAPVLEETLFRGFLLTSLTKWMPTPAAVVVSAAAFGCAHLSGRDLPQLVALGTLLGFSYVRSRNLLTPMLIHGVWNGTVLTVLYVLSSQGIDINSLLQTS